MTNSDPMDTIAEKALRSVRLNIGFDNRQFLTEEEWDTFRRRKPVRYIKKQHTRKCTFCGRPPTDKNPFQHSHRIGFEVGVIYLGLTPEYVDSEKNVVTAHRTKCNASSELNLLAAMQLLKDGGVKALPKYLPEEIQELWRAISG